jgi:hypothetical protein
LQAFFVPILGLSALLGGKFSKFEQPLSQQSFSQKTHRGDSEDGPVTGFAQEQQNNARANQHRAESQQGNAQI